MLMMIYENTIKFWIIIKIFFRFVINCLLFNKIAHVPNTKQSFYQYPIPYIKLPPKHPEHQKGPRSYLFLI
jgi:hypothetical protein